MPLRVGVRKWLGLKLFAKLYRHNVAEHELRTLFWECTLRCNLACRHCGSDCRVEAEQPDMPIEDFLHVIDTQITPHVNPNRVMVIISGGEVLVRKDLERVGLELYKRGYPWAMVTNGMGLDRERLDSLIRAGLHSITVSLDGFEDDHNYIRQNPDSFKRALTAVKMISQEDLAYDIVTCVTGRSVGRLEEFKEFLISEGIKAWRIFTIFPIGRSATDPTLCVSDKQLVELMEFIKRTRREGRLDIRSSCVGFVGTYEADVRDHFYHCTAGVTTASIRVDGAISGCTSIRSNFNQGNIYKDNFWEVWTNRFHKFRNRDWAKKGDCKDCKVFELCQGGGMHLRDDNENLLTCHYKRISHK